MFTFISRRWRTAPNFCLRIAFCTLLVAITLTFHSIVAYAATYMGTNTGPIPDGPSPSRSCGTPRDVTFNVAGFTGNFGSASVTFNATHSWVGDLEVSLIAPNGVTHLLFSFVGSNSNNDRGDNSNLGAAYTFSDAATANFWTAAARVGPNTIIPGGSYRTQAAGPFGNDNPGPPFTSINATFAGMTQAQINGTWMLRFRDCWKGNTGSVSSASLTIQPLAAGPASAQGRVVTSDGRGIKGAMIVVSGGNLSEPRIVVTNTFGFYRVPNLESGEAYVFTVMAKKYLFRENSIFVSLDGDLHGLDFIADP